MALGWGKILRKLGVDADLTDSGDSEWTVTNINKTRNNFLTLGSLRLVQTLCSSRELYAVSATQVIAPGHGVPVEIDWTQIAPGGGAATYNVLCVPYLYTNDAGTSVTGYLRRTSGTAANVLTFGPSTTVAWTAQTQQAVPVSTGVQTYEFHVIGGNADAGVRAIAALFYYAP